MRIFEWMAELRYRNPLLYRVGLINFIIGIILIVPLLMDTRQVMGINTWVKPLKFCISIGIYAWTFGWILFDIPGSKRIKSILTWTIGISMTLELALIIYQAARGTQSHFNIATGFDATVFSLMGVMVGINTLAIVATFILYLVKKTTLDRAYLLAIRLGFIVFLVGNWIGGVMIGKSAHSVGVEDGGDGMPFTNWSTEGGDLRIAHFLGLHAIQAIPLFSYFLIKNTNLSLASRRVLTVLFTLIYGGAVSFLYFQAMRGVPMIAAD